MTPTPPASAAECDVLIIGGGLVGASLAIALAPTGVSVTMVEAAPAGALPPVFDQRNLSLAEASVNALSTLGVLPLLRTRSGAIRRIHVSRSGDAGRIVLDAADHGRSEFGRVVVASDFGDALEAQLARLPGLVRHRPARFVGFADGRGGDGGVRTVVVDGEAGPRQLRARLVVAADGAASSVRAAAGIDADVHDYQQDLFVARLRTQAPADGQAWERLTDAGPTALLPRGDGAYGLVHGVARAQADSVAALGDAAFLERVQGVFGWRAGRFREVGARSRYPLQRIVAQRLVGDRLVLVGNAAQSIHPLGAQGFNLGLRDALTLAEGIAAAPADAGDARLLRTYAQRRAEDRRRTLAFSDGLARLSSSDAPLLRPLRSIGLLAAGQLDWVQALLVGGAMGYRGDVPALCRLPAASTGAQPAAGAQA